MPEEMYREHEPIEGREKKTKVHFEEVEKSAEQPRRRYKEGRRDGQRNPSPKTDGISRTTAVGAILLMAIMGGLERRKSYNT